MPIIYAPGMALSSKIGISTQIYPPYYHALTDYFRPTLKIMLDRGMDPPYVCGMGQKELERILRRLRWSHSELARALGVSESTVTRWVNGSRPISEMAAKAIRAVTKGAS